MIYKKLQRYMTVTLGQALVWTFVVYVIGVIVGLGYGRWF